MRRVLTVVVACAVAVSSIGLFASVGQETKYGTALTLTEVTKVSDIYANPEKYNGKRVQVQGPVVDVCTDMGCWLALGSDQEDQTIRFKVEDGVIVFPISARGKNAKVEGVLVVAEGPEVSVQIKGEGAIVY